MGLTPAWAPSSQTGSAVRPWHTFVHPYLWLSQHCWWSRSKHQYIGLACLLGSPIPLRAMAA